MTAVIASAAGRPRDSWADPARGNVRWVTLFSADATPTAGMSAGIAEIPPQAGELHLHRHAQAELYFVHAGAGLLTVDGVTTPIAAGMSVFIPGDAEHGVRNPGDETLVIFYVFPTDRFADVVYRFPGEADGPGGDVT